MIKAYYKNGLMVKFYPINLLEIEEVLK